MEALGLRKERPGGRTPGSGDVYVKSLESDVSFLGLIYRTTTVTLLRPGWGWLWAGPP